MTKKGKGSNFNHQQLPCPQITQISTDNNAAGQPTVMTNGNKLPPITPAGLLTHEGPTNVQSTQ